MADTTAPEDATVDASDAGAEPADVGMEDVEAPPSAGKGRAGQVVDSDDEVQQQPAEVRYAQNLLPACKYMQSCALKCAEAPCQQGMCLGGDPN